MANPSSISLNNLLNPPQQHQRRNGDDQEGSEKEMWNLYLNEVNEDDKLMADVLKQDAESVLVFTGLFSATVGSFIIEFYKKLLPDSASNTANQPFSPSASMIWVNALWLISLVLSVTSALIATLLQQWARGYVETPKSSIELKRRARIRSLLFRGMISYKIFLLVEILPTLLHLSVYLFFGGLIIIFHTINKKVAIAVDASVGLSGLAYIALTILPCIDVKCPFRTPISKISWYPWHAFLFVTARCLFWLVKQLFGCLVQPSLDGNLASPWLLKLIDWSNSCEEAIWKQGQYLKDGFWTSLVNHYSVARADGDHQMVISMFIRLALGDKNKFMKFAASIPRDRFRDINPPIESLIILLRSIAAGTGATGPDEDVLKRSLVCLEAMHYLSKIPVTLGSDLVRAFFANIGLMQTLWGDSDTTTRVTSRSVCALITWRVGRRNMLEVEELRWLEDVTGETPHDILNADVETRDRMIFKSFVYGVLSNQVGDLPTEDATSFGETLAILLDVGTDPHFDLDSSQNRLSEGVGWIHKDDPQGSHEVVYRLLSMFPFIASPFPPPP